MSNTDLPLLFSELVAPNVLKSSPEGVRRAIDGGHLLPVGRTLGGTVLYRLEDRA